RAASPAGEPPGAPAGDPSGARSGVRGVSTPAAGPDWATIPNLVTLARFVLLVPVCLLLADGPDTLAVVLLLVWASTDWIDGMLARLLDQRSRTGAIIDPIADRIGLAGIVLSLAFARSEEHTSELQSRENLVCRLL